MQPADTHPGVAADHDSLSAPGPRKALAGFFVLGVLLAFLGAILPSWGHHLLSDYWMVGLYFVALIGGLTSAVRVAPCMLRRKGIRATLAVSCAAASVSLLVLAFFSPPFSAWWRLPRHRAVRLRGRRPAYRDFSRDFTRVSPRSGGHREPRRRSPWTGLFYGSAARSRGCFTRTRPPQSRSGSR